MMARLKAGSRAADRRAPQRRRVGAPATAQVPPSPDDNQAVGRAVMEQLLQLEKRTTPGLAAEVMPVFLRDMTVRLAAVREATARVDAVEAHRLAHTIHGSAASIGAVTMVRACAEILRHVRDGNLDQCAPLISALIADLESIRRAAAAHGITAP